LRLSAQFSDEAIESLRFNTAIAEEMQWVYEKFGDEIYTNISENKPEIEKYLQKNDIKLTAKNKKNLLSQTFWQNQKEIKNSAEKIAAQIGRQQFDDFNEFKKVFARTIKSLSLKLDAKTQKTILTAISWKNEDAQPVIKKQEKDGTVIFEADSELRDTENVPLDEEIQSYFEREVLAHVPDAWIDYSKTVKGYEISFTRYFYQYEPPEALKKLPQRSCNWKKNPMVF